MKAHMVQGLDPQTLSTCLPVFVMFKVLNIRHEHASVQARLGELSFSDIALIIHHPALDYSSQSGLYALCKSYIIMRPSVQS